jgi:hypothetical protein
MLVSSFNLSQSINYAPYIFCKKRFKSEINCFCIRTLTTWLCSGVSLSSGGTVFNLAATQFYPLIAVGPTSGSSITYHLVSGFFNLFL